MSTMLERPVTEGSPYEGFTPFAGSRRWLPMLAIFLPVLLFFGVCLRYMVPIPVSDDYDAVLLYQDGFARLQTLGQQLHYVVYTQHNEYKPVYANAVIAAEYAAEKHADLNLLSVLGDLQVLILGYFLWKSFLPRDVEVHTRLLLFLPVVLVLFQLNYNENLNWPMPCLQNIGVLVFALIALYFASKLTAGAFAVACCGLVLCIAASGNGFALLPVGLLMFWEQRALRRAAVWVGVTLLCGLIYFTHYNVMSAQQPGNNSVLTGSHHFNVLFILSFLGASVGLGKPVFREASAVLGLLLCGVIVHAVRRRFSRANPTIAYYGMFVMVTALGVSGIRAGFGYDQSLMARYKIYSDLLLVCAYSYGLYAFSSMPQALRQRFYRGALVAACLFWCFGNAVGLHQMRSRYRDLIAGMNLYVQSKHTAGPYLPDPLRPEVDAVLNVRFRHALDVAEHDGIYHARSH